MPNTKYNYGTLRVKQETLELLRNMKEAYEVSNDKTYTYDEFIRQMVFAIKEGAPEIWEIYCVKQQQKIELQEKIVESRKLRENI